MLALKGLHNDRHGLCFTVPHTNLREEVLAFTIERGADVTISNDVLTTATKIWVSFDVDDLVGRAGLEEYTRKQLENALGHLARTGRLERVERGVYRAMMLPAAVKPVSAVVSVAGVELEDIRWCLVDEDPWFCLRDVMAFLGMSANTAAARVTARLESDEHRVLKRQGGVQGDAVFVSISGLLGVAHGSQMDSGRKLARWARAVAGRVALGKDPVTGESAIAKSSHDPMIAQLEMLIEQRKHVLRVQEEQEKIKAVQEMIAERVDQIEAKQEAAARALTTIQIAPPTETVPEKTTRARIVEIVAAAGFFNGNNDEDHRKCWHRLYAEFRSRKHVDIPARAKARGVRNKLDVAESDGLLDALYTVAVDLFRDAIGH